MKGNALGDTEVFVAREEDPVKAELAETLATRGLHKCDTSRVWPNGTGVTYKSSSSF
jgi:hypothetical protein